MFQEPGLLKNTKDLSSQKTPHIKNLKKKELWILNFVYTW